MSTKRALGVDLWELWMAGRSYIPNVADQFLEATGPLHQARADGASFRSCEVGTGRPYGAGSQVGDLAEVLHGYLVETRDNLYAVGKVIKDAANNYEYTDAEAAEEFEQRKRNERAREMQLAEVDR